MTDKPYDWFAFSRSARERNPSHFVMREDGSVERAPVKREMTSALDRAIQSELLLTKEERQRRKRIQAGLEVEKISPSHLDAAAREIALEIAAISARVVNALRIGRRWDNGW